MTPRQGRLLKAIIDEFINSAEAVGSVNLANKHHLGVSPATIRNEMSALVKQGYLAKPHSSSGRVPTNLGFRYFIESLLDELEELEVASTTSMKEQLFQSRFNADDLLTRAVSLLATSTNLLALSLLQHRVYYAGLANLLAQPDYRDMEEIRELFKVIEDSDQLLAIFNRYQGLKKIKILIGEDTGFGSFAKSSLIFTPIKLHGEAHGFMALIGPNRMDYAHNIPLLEYVADTVNGVINGW